MEMDTLFCFSLRLSFGILCGLLTHFPSMSTIQFRAEWHTVHQFSAFVLESAESCETTHSTVDHLCANTART